MSKSVENVSDRFGLMKYNLFMYMYNGSFKRVCVLVVGLCSADTCFNGGRCAHEGDQVCECPAGFQGSRCQYGEFGNPVLLLWTDSVSPSERAGRSEGRCRCTVTVD